MVLTLEVSRQFDGDSSRVRERAGTALARVADATLPFSDPSPQRPSKRGADGAPSRGGRRRILANEAAAGANWQLRQQIGGLRVQPLRPTDQKERLSRRVRFHPRTFRAPPRPNLKTELGAARPQRHATRVDEVNEAAARAPCPRPTHLIRNRMVLLRPPSPSCSHRYCASATMPAHLLKWLVGVASVAVGAAAAATAESAQGGARGSGPYPSAADYVIVGGGTAGCVLAARLCARFPAASVVLIERGRPRTPAQEFKVRAMSAVPDAWVDPALTEAWASEANPGLGGRPVTLLTGATLGGSSSINSGQWSVPVAPYASTLGVDGLTEAAAQRLYDAAARVVHPAVPPPSVTPVYTEKYLAAAAAAGVPILSPPPLRGDSRGDGIWVSPMTADAGGRRRDACTAYLDPVVRPGGACASNLVLLLGTTVTKVVLSERRADADGARYNATGVEVVPSAPVDKSSAAARAAAAAADAAAGRGPTTIAARRQVLLTAGPFGSPKILQLSGIGPAASLRAAGILPRVELPVGAAARSRAATVLIAAYRGVPLAPTANVTARTAPTAVATWRSGGGGVVGTVVTSAFGRLAATHSSVVVSWAPPGAKPEGVPLLVSTCLGVPAAAATMAVADAASPAAPLRVAPNLLGGGGADGAAEVAAAIACLTRLRRVTAALPSAFELVDVTPPPGVAVNADLVRGSATSAHHTVGGAAVGPVLTPSLGVRGVDGLRVIDASAIPSIPESSGLLATVYMLAEYAAEQLVEGQGPWGEA